MYERLLGASAFEV
jgi:hypothetical protein